MTSKATKHFNHQRFTALILVPLILWFIISMIRMVGADHVQFLAWAGEPLTAGLLILLIGALFYHMRLGMDEVIEDYIQSKSTRAGLLLLNKVFALILGAASLFAVIVITLNH